MTSIRCLGAIWLVLLLMMLASGFAGTEVWAAGMFNASVCILGIAALSSLYGSGVKAFLDVPVPVVVFGAIALIAFSQLLCGASVYPFATEVETVQWLSAAALAFTTACLAHDPHARRILLNGLYAGGVLIILFGIAHFYTCGGRLLWSMTNEFGPTFAPFINRDHFAVFCELILPFAVVSATSSSTRASAHAVIAALIWAGIVISGSRMGLLVSTIEWITIFLLRRRYFRSYAQLTACACGIALLGILFALIGGPDVLLRKLQAPAGWEYRVMMAGSAARMGLERPFTGLGLGTFETAYPRFAQFDLGLRVDHAHNDWLEWFAEGGILMPLCMAAFVTSVLRRMRESPWLVGVPAVLLHACVDFPWHIPAIAAFAIAIASAGQPFKFAASSNTRVKKSRDVGEQPICNVPLFGDSSTKPK